MPTTPKGKLTPEKIVEILTTWEGEIAAVPEGWTGQQAARKAAGLPNSKPAGTDKVTSAARKAAGLEK